MNKQLPASIEPTDLTLSTKQDTTPALRQRLNSAELFSESREVIIEHAGEEYRLRLTRQDKLILTK
ncbi:hemin uptake protein HemP [Methylobacter sp.]|uniref:hemin uptake protein HemP n=1 Tax=Methylobacter sp. TaxID=2051955 RepID=UPI00248852AF|nr:hemin uptake protein HemP [Methylobacter sp.]MDI1279318.1 hemin uptake protein HemP [Methylobacter sp.]MDI1360080.1 hemin uptake protein HemP [Methylobacter sp.]